MMGGGAFIPLKAGLGRPESREQAKIRLADLRRILWIGPLKGGKSARQSRQVRAKVKFKAISAGYG
jgi:hypothetical protein